MTGSEEEPPVENRWRKLVRTARETRRGRFLFILGLCLFGTWMWTLVIWGRDLLLSGSVSWEPARPFSESFNLGGLHGRVGKLASGVPYEWWAILCSVLVLLLCFLGARFLDGTHGRATWGSLGLRGRVSRHWKWIACLVLLPGVVRIAYVYLGTEPAWSYPPFSWKVYLFPYSEIDDGMTRWWSQDEGSSRPAWLLRSMLGAIAYAVLLYGFTWPRLRRIGISFVGSAVLLVVTERAVHVILYYVPQLETLSSSWDVAGGVLIALAIGAVHVPVSGWIVERWGGRVWPLAIASFALQLPELLVDFRYLGSITTSPFESYSASLLLHSAWGIMPLALLALLALLTLLGPRLGLPSLREKSATATPTPGA